MRLINAGKGIGDEIGPVTVRRRDTDGKVKEYVHVPDVHSGIRCEWVNDHDLPCRCDHRNLREHKAGNVYVSLFGHGFAVVPKGEAFELPAGVSMKAIRNMCPHLIPEEDHLGGKVEEEIAELHPQTASLSASSSKSKKS